MATQKVQKLSMGASGKEEEQKVTFEDQKKINMFAQYNIELGDLKTKLQALNKQVSYYEFVLFTGLPLLQVTQT